jgi:hypothetical protein
MALNNYQFQFGSFVFGGASSPYQIQSIDGLEALPDLRTQDDNRGYNDGMFSGRDFYAGRTITMEIYTFAGGGNSAQQNFDLLQQALIPQASGTTTLQFLLSQYDTEKQIGARVRGRRTTVDKDYTFGFIRSQYTFFCPDPRYYSNTSTTATFTVNNGTLGRTYNRTYNMTYGGGSLVNSVTVTNSGWVTTYPVITITGPATNPIIGNQTTGQILTVNTSLANTDTLVIDLNQKLVTLNGVSARNLVAGNSVWFGAAPGASTFFFLASNLVAGTSTASITYRSAYV